MGSGEDPLVASTSEARSPLPPGAVAEDGCAVGDVATVAVSGVPMDGVGSSPPAFATVPTPESTTESAPADPVPEPIPKPAEACPPPEPVPDPVPTPATLDPDGSELYEGLVRFESFAPCVTVEAVLGAGSESRAGEGPDVRAEAESEAEAGSEAASEGGVKSEAGVEGGEVVAAGSRGEVGGEVAGSIESVARAGTSPESGTSPGSRRHPKSRRRPGSRRELRLRPALIHAAVSSRRQEHRRWPGRRLQERLGRRPPDRSRLLWERRSRHPDWWATCLRYRERARSGG